MRSHLRVCSESGMGRSAFRRSVCAVALGIGMVSMDQTDSTPESGPPMLKAFSGLLGLYFLFEVFMTDHAPRPAGWGKPVEMVQLWRCASCNARSELVFLSSDASDYCWGRIVGAHKTLSPGCQSPDLVVYPWRVQGGGDGAAS